MVGKKRAARFTSRMSNERSADELHPHLKRVDSNAVSAYNRSRLRVGCFLFTCCQVSPDPSHVVNRFVVGEEGRPPGQRVLQRKREEQALVGSVPEFLITEVFEMDHLSLLYVLFDNDGFRVNVRWLYRCCLHK